MTFFIKTRNPDRRPIYTITNQLFTGIFLLVVQRADAQQLTLKVDLSSIIRPVTRCASGSLYGMTQTLPSDIAELVAPLNPLEFAQPARAGTGNQHNNGAGALSVANRLSAVKTARIQVYLTDLLPNWPYKWPGQASWISQVTSFVNDKKASGVNNIYAYNIWNEPNGTWTASNGDFYAECWVPTYKLLGSMDPETKIIGPGDAYYNRSRIKDFLSFCKNNDCLPDIMCWHELQGCANISSHVKDYRSLEKELGISELPISINEYCHSDKPKEGCPGASAPFIAKFERNKIESACISWWFTALPGRLGSLLTSGNQKNGGWWFYKWYGDMTGNIVSVTPPNDNSDGIDGFACLDMVSGYAGICLGGNYKGTVNVEISGIPEKFGTGITVKIEFIEWKDKDTPVGGPTLVSEKVITAAGGKMTVPVTVTSELYGYRVYLVPEHGIVASDKRFFPKAACNGPVMQKNASGNLLAVSVPGNAVEGGTEVSVYHSSGKLVRCMKSSGIAVNIPTGNLASGTYIVTVRYGTHFFTQQLLFK